MLRYLFDKNYIPENDDEEKYEIYTKENNIFKYKFIIGNSENYGTKCFKIEFD